MIQPAAAQYGFNLEYLGENPGYDELDRYLRNEFHRVHPGWDPVFGRVARYDAGSDSHDFLYVISGKVPQADSSSEAEEKVRKLFEEIARKLKLKLPKPDVNVWRRAEDRPHS